MPAERCPIAVSLDIPEPNRLIGGSARQGPSVRTPSYRFYPIGMSDQRLEEVSSGDLPELDGLVPVCTGKQAPVGGKGLSRSPVGVPHQDRNAGCRPGLLYLPEPDLPIGATTSEQASIGTPGASNGKDRLRMRQCLEKRTRLRIPEPDGRISPPTGHYVAIGGIGETRDIARMPPRPEQSAQLHSPQFDHPIITPAGQAKSIWAEAQERDNICVGLPDQMQRLVSPHPDFPSPVACSAVVRSGAHRYGRDGTKRISKGAIHARG